MCRAEFKKEESYVSDLKALAGCASIWAYFLLLFGAPRVFEPFMHQINSKILKRRSWKH
jgi:hypothetical protein